jgi:uncharacterized protein YutD
MSILPCLILRNVQSAVNSSSLNEIFSYLDYLFIYVMAQLSNDQLQRQQKYIEETNTNKQNQNQYQREKKFAKYYWNKPFCYYGW